MYKQIVIVSILLILGMCTVSGEIVYKTTFENHSICIDESKYNNHGVYYNINFTTGIINYASDYNDINSRIVIQNPTELSFTDNVTDSPFSLSFWVNRHGLRHA